MPSFTPEQLRDIGLRMRSLRDQLGLTQNRMSKLLDISLSHYSKLEIGYGTLGAKLIRNFQNQFGISREWLTSGQGELPDLAKIQERIKDNILMPASQPATSEVDLDKIIEIALRPDLQKLSEEISDKTGITRAHALALLVRQILKNS